MTPYLTPQQAQYKIECNPPKFKTPALEALWRLHLARSKRDYPQSFHMSWSEPLLKYQNKKPANRLTSMCIDFLNLSGHLAERINCQGQYRDQSKVVSDCLGRKKKIGSGFWAKSTATKGSSDIKAIIRGISISFEIKVGKDFQSQAQNEYQKSVESAGGKYYIIKDFDQFFSIYKSII